MKIVNKRYMVAHYGVTGSVSEYEDGTARLKVRDGVGRIVHNKVHKNPKAAMAAWYRANT